MFNYQSILCTHQSYVVHSINHNLTNRVDIGKHAITYFITSIFGYNIEYNH